MKTKQQEAFLLQVGARLKSLREKAGYTSHETFAVDYDLSRMQYWRMEKGVANMTMLSLHRILEIHKISATEFFSAEFG